MIYWLVFMATVITLLVITIDTKVNGAKTGFGLRVLLVCCLSAVNTGAFWLLSSLFGL